MTAPLEGIRVVEMTSVVLGPYACQMLGDLGADVIKIEPPAGDTNRNLGPHSNHSDMCSMYLGCNRNKRSVALDLKSERGRQAALEIMKNADVVVHNFRPQAMSRLGLDYSAVKAVNPNVVYCATYGYSKAGPYGDKGALDDSIQAASGAAALAEKVLGEPRYMPTIIADKDHLAEGSQLVVRYTFLGDVYRFKTHVLGTNREPFKVTFLSCPGVVEKIDVRDTQRVHCFFPATLVYDELEIKGMLTDISVGGCKFKTEAVEQIEGLLLKKEGNVSVQFQLPGHAGTKNFHGTVKKVEFDTTFALGIGFRDIDEDIRRVMASYVENTSGYHP